MVKKDIEYKAYYIILSTLYDFIDIMLGNY